MGSKYTMEFHVTGNADPALQRIEHGLTKVHSEAVSMRKGVEGASESLESLNKIGEFFAFEEIIGKFEEISEKAREFATKIFEHGEELVKDFLGTASEFQDIQSSLQFSFGKDWQEMYDKAYQQAQHLSFTFKQTSDLVANLGKTGVNVFGKMGEGMKTFTAKTGEQIGALDVLQDTLVGTGLSFQESGRLLRGVHEAIIGNFREFKMGLAMPPKLIEEMKHKVSGAAGDMQKAFEGVVGVLAKFYGGATKLKEMNLSFQVQQLQDKFELLKGAIAGPSLELVTQGLKAFVDALQHLLEDKDAMKALSDAFKVLGQTVNWIFRAAAAMVGFVESIAKAAPFAIALGVGLTVVGAAAAFAGSVIGGLVLFTLGAAAAFVVLTANVWSMTGSLITSLGAWVMTTLGINVATGAATLFEIVTGLIVVSLGALVLVLGLVAATFVAFGVAMGGLVIGGLALVGIFQDMSDAGNDVYSIFDKINTVFSAFSQLISSYNGKTSEMSLETADKLKGMGLMGFVLNVMDAFNKLDNMWHGFMDTLEEVGNFLKPIIMPMLDHLYQLIFDVAHAFGFATGAVDINKKSATDWSTTGMQVAEILLKITGYVIKLIDWFVKLADGFVEAGERFMASPLGHFLGFTAKSWLGKGILGGLIGGDEDKGGEGGDINKFDLATAVANRRRARLSSIPEAPEGVPYQYTPGQDLTSYDYTSMYGGGSSQMPPGATSDNFSFAPSGGGGGARPMTAEHGDQLVQGVQNLGKQISGLTSAIQQQPQVIEIDGQAVASAIKRQSTSVDGGS